MGYNFLCPAYKSQCPPLSMTISVLLNCVISLGFSDVPSKVNETLPWRLRIENHGKSTGMKIAYLGCNDISDNAAASIAFLLPTCKGSYPKTAVFIVTAMRTSDLTQ
jgi:hypothetical protein